MALANFWKARAVVLEKAIKERDAEIERLTRSAQYWESEALTARRQQRRLQLSVRGR